MFKKIFILSLVVIVVGALAFSAYNTTQARRAQVDSTIAGTPAPLGNGRGQANGQSASGIDGQPASLHADLAALPTGELDDAEVAALLYMREEEKLAHDVYVTLYEQWGLATFQTIALSEQAHSDAVKALLDRYGLADPASAEVGVFSDSGLQALYGELIARGSQSLAEAVKVGGAIEEIDILDLETRLLQTDNTDLQQVFNNLMSGSYNHLRAFVNALSQQTGETYQPQSLSPEAYQAIVDAPMGRGNGGHGGGGSQGGGNGRQGGGSGGGNGGGYRGGRS